MRCPPNESLHPTKDLGVNSIKSCGIHLRGIATIATGELQRTGAGGSKIPSTLAQQSFPRRSAYWLLDVN